MLGIIILLAILAWLAVTSYNKLVNLKNQVQNAWKQIDVQLKRRYDLIPNLVESVKGAMDFEKDTLEKVIQARNQAIGALNSGDIKAASAADSALNSALGKLMVVVEAYPDLKATSQAGQLMEELISTESRISFARQAYNDTAMRYNTVQESFPTMFFTGLAKAERATLWEIEDPKERENIKVDLGQRKRSE